MSWKNLLLLPLCLSCGSSAGSGDASAVGSDGASQDAPVSSYCNPIYQIGCNPGRRCTIQHGPEGEPYGPPLCVSSAGSIPLGEACTVTAGEVDDCVAGAICRQGVCVSYCSQPTPTCEVGFCPRYPLEAGPEFSFWVCARTCDPVAPDCAVGESCYLAFPGYGTAGCVETGAVEAGQQCNDPEDCVDGYACSEVIGDGDAGLTAACRQICAVDGVGPTCSGPSTCVAVLGNAGVCE